MTEIAVTGATGRVGGRVARRLADAGVPQRLLVRDPGRAPQLPQARVVPAEYRDQAAAVAALKGARTLFMVSAAENADRLTEHRAFVDAAVRAGITRILYLSFYRAAPTAAFTLARDHWATEEHIRDSGMAFTFLRDNLYADFIPFIVSDGIIRGPAGTGRVSAVAIDDVAACAAAVLLDPERHAGATYSLTGPQALTLDEVAQTYTEVTGTPTHYVPETVAEAYASRGHYGAPAWQVDAWVTTYTAIAAGEADGVSDDVARLSGRPATPLAQVLRHPATA